MASVPSAPTAAGWSPSETDGAVWDLALRKEVATLLDRLMVDVKFNPNGQECFTSGPDGLHRWSLDVARKNSGSRQSAGSCIRAGWRG